MHDDRDQRIIGAILAGGVKIPPMPGVLVEFQALSRDPDAGPREYARLVSRDAALAGALFRVAGSPVFGLRSKVDSLDKVVTLLGLRTTAAVVRGEALRTALSDPDHLAVMNALWERMHAVAAWMLAIHKAVRPRGLPQDQVFLLGIFHDCGIAVLCRRFPGYARAFKASGGWPDLDALDHQFQTSHTVVGQMVARNWQLPQDLALAIRHHHDADVPDLPVDVLRLIAVFQFALHLYLRHGGQEDPDWALWQGRVMASLGLDEVELSDLEEALLAGQD